MESQSGTEERGLLSIWVKKEVLEELGPRSTENPPTGSLIPTAAKSSTTHAESSQVGPNARSSPSVQASSSWHFALDF